MEALCQHTRRAYYALYYAGIFDGGLITYIKIPYRTKLWRGENFGEFSESPQFAKFFRQHSR